ncbi:hypothetical protein HX004_03410 [Myroides sp. 1354]|uniref:hypothetical protein n=1 Tax=unclassified Myroides TaxID=2642485 RepID=UPI002578F105|nr:MULTISPECIES: hypothetical protein [unclassified Myroides]MDM1043893.1 hypothetical protein [Myroides sp. R163-1]MDM1054828.1 hypothetical protein [Myroides sp. 1354]MDM1068125.1 hypothetical protein [Myroides sp. 1372]
MKKLFMFLAVAGLATFGASCGSDDSKNDDPKQKDLALSADKTSVKEGDAVAFTVKVDGKVEAGAELYIGTEKISSPYTFAKEGKYEVKAKKKDFNDSNVVTITVKKDEIPTDPLKLTLTPSKTEVFVNEAVTFTVKDENGANVTGFTVKQANGTAVAGGVFTSTAAGTFKFVASKDGYVTSDEVSVVVKEQNIPENYVKLNGEYTEITNLKRVYINGIKNAQGQFQPYIYTDEGTYSIVTYELGTIDEQAQAYVTRSSTMFVTNQVIGQPYQWPANVGEDTFIASSAVADFEAGRFVPFDLSNELVDVAIADSDTDFLLTLHVENDANGIKFDGTLGTGYYWREVDADGNLVQGAASVKISAKFLKNSVFGGRKSVK